MTDFGLLSNVHGWLKHNLCLSNIFCLFSVGEFTCMSMKDYKYFIFMLFYVFFQELHAPVWSFMHPFFPLFNIKNSTWRCFAWTIAHFSEINEYIIIWYRIMLVVLKLLGPPYTKNKYRKAFVQRQKHVWGPFAISARRCKASKEPNIS